MGIFLLIIHFLLPLTQIITVFAVVFVGAIMYFLVLFQLDRKIHDEIRYLCTSLGIPWPARL
jgi:hypothetical protein